MPQEPTALQRRAAARWSYGPRAAAALALFACGATARPPAPPPSPKPEVLLEVRSVTEEARDLIDLLMPFLARLNFAEHVRRIDADTGYTTTSFLGSNGDYVGVGGRHGCLVVRFVAARESVGPAGRGVPDRVADFSHQLSSFLQGLPTPRPVARTVTPGGPAGCAVAGRGRALDHAPSPPPRSPPVARGGLRRSGK